jgi:hypothetical protein
MLFNKGVIDSKLSLTAVAHLSDFTVVHEKKHCQKKANNLFFLCKLKILHKSLKKNFYDS